MAGAVVLRIVDLLVQLLLIATGLDLIASTEDDTMLFTLLVWCLLGTLYWLASVIAVAVSVRMRTTTAPAWLVRFELHPVVGLISTVATFVASFAGIVAVVLILVFRNDPEWSGWVEPIAVWAMLLSWALFHWGFARIYHRRYRSAPIRPLHFPGTAEPRLVDFVYFSFTNATTFSVSDVQVMTSGMRFIVVWHTTMSFFLNALIIVLAFSTIING